MRERGGGFGSLTEESLGWNRSGKEREGVGVGFRREWEEERKTAREERRGNVEEAAMDGREAELRESM